MTTLHVRAKMEEMRRRALVPCVVVALATMSTTALAQTTPTTGDRTDKLSPDDSSNRTDPALDIGARPAPGEASMVGRFVSSADIGLWARAPQAFSADGRPLVLAGGDIGLASWLTLRLYGVDDFMFHRFSGMSAGLTAWLLPKSSPIQLTASGGYMQSTTQGAPALWGQVAATAAFGLFTFGASLRTQADLGAPSNTPGFTSVVSATYGKLIKIGVAWVTEGGTANAPARQAIVPSVTATTKRGNIDFGASTSFGVGATPTIPLTLRVGGRF